MEHVSFVTAAHNEGENLALLVGEIRAAARDIGLPYEILIVDDGSTDGSGDWLEKEAAAHDDLRSIRFPKNRGQSAAMAVGLAQSKGDVIVTMDADLQNDPADARLLLDALAEADLATGVRANRRDRFFKRIGSRIGNGVRRLILGDRFKDVGCQIRAWRRPVAERIPKFKGFHRFIPVLAQAEGFRIREVDVNHRHRQHGTTHYGNLGRAFAGLYDLIGVRWLRKRRIDTSVP
jgi:glycosyltransferase involved in cell wall biosynthesis